MYFIFTWTTLVQSLYRNLNAAGFVMSTLWLNNLLPKSITAIISHWLVATHSTVRLYLPWQHSCSPCTGTLGRQGGWCRQTDSRRWPRPGPATTAGCTHWGPHGLDHTHGTASWGSAEKISQTCISFNTSVSLTHNDLNHTKKYNWVQQSRLYLILRSAKNRPYSWYNFVRNWWISSKSVFHMRRMWA